jgi:hypothetical protein
VPSEVDVKPNSLGLYECTYPGCPKVPALCSCVVRTAPACAQCMPLPALHAS